MVDRVEAGERRDDRAARPGAGQAGGGKLLDQRRVRMCKNAADLQIAPAGNVEQPVPAASRRRGDCLQLPGGKPAERRMKPHQQTVSGRHRVQYVRTPTALGGTQLVKFRRRLGWWICGQAVRSPATALSVTRKPAAPAEKWARPAGTPRPARSRVTTSGWPVSWLAGRRQTRHLPRHQPSGFRALGSPLTVAGAAAAWAD